MSERRKTLVESLLLAAGNRPSTRTKCAVSLDLTTIHRLQSVLGCTWQHLFGKELKKKAG